MRAESGVDGGESGSMTIPLHSLQRRRSRDTNTSLDDEDSYREANRLMQQGRGSYDPQDDVRERQNGDAPRTDYSRWLKPISIIFAVVFLVLILFISFKTLSVTPLTQSKSSNFQPGSSDGTLGIVLHPETHAHRPPHDITQHWNITSDFRSPDGVKKEVYLINGELPGPLIECRSGDRLSIHVTNQLDSDAVSIHWHGLSMRGANAMDGAPGFTQCSILPGASFTYEFDIDADASGTFWYHAHSQVQRGDGMYGGLIVHKPADKDSDLGKYGNEKEVLLLIGDWYHRSSTDVLNWYMSVRGFGNEVSPFFVSVIWLVGIYSDCIIART
jgi:FtsP/CotA-like multicopper oxidase with cupredoxin domain